MHTSWSFPSNKCISSISSGLHYSSILSLFVEDSRDGKDILLNPTRLTNLSMPCTVDYLLFHLVKGYQTLVLTSCSYQRYLSYRFSGQSGANHPLPKSPVCLLMSCPTLEPLTWTLEVLLIHVSGLIWPVVGTRASGTLRLAYHIHMYITVTATMITSCHDDKNP